VIRAIEYMLYNTVLLPNPKSYWHWKWYSVTCLLLDMTQHATWCYLGRFGARCGCKPPGGNNDNAILICHLNWLTKWILTTATSSLCVQLLLFDTFAWRTMLGKARPDFLDLMILIIWEVSSTPLRNIWYKPHHPHSSSLSIKEGCTHKIWKPHKYP
jgi:hypothetical protein